MKKNIFNGRTFAVVEDSFDDQSYVEGFSRWIIENGGKVLASDQKAHFVVFEDGHREDIW